MVFMTKHMYMDTLKAKQLMKFLRDHSYEVTRADELNKEQLAEKASTLYMHNDYVDDWMDFEKERENEDENQAGHQQDLSPEMLEQIKEAHDEWRQAEKHLLWAGASSQDDAYVNHGARLKYRRLEQEAKDINRMAYFLWKFKDANHGVWGTK
jgi:hypothetical protein